MRDLLLSMMMDDEGRVGSLLTTLVRKMPAVVCLHDRGESETAQDRGSSSGRKHRT
jgi:hypothetical protein